MDFTLRIYKHLLLALKAGGYTFQPFAEFIEHPQERSIVLRHDVDAKNLNSLQFAKIQAGQNIKGTYFFRIVPKSFDKNIIKEIEALGHEIGYHYETMDTSGGEPDKAYDEFRRNLEIFRKIVPIKTICMHGSPLSKYDNKDLWKKYNYKELGIIGEPYFDIDFSKVGYLTDTGRRWDGTKVSVRDKIKKDIIQHPKPNIQDLSFHSTKDIIHAANNKLLPDQLMLTFHPQRWTNKPMPWVKELIWQNMKNVIKRLIIKN